MLEDCPAQVVVFYGQFSLHRETVALVEQLTNPSKQYPKLRRAERKQLDRDHIVRASYWARVIKLCDRLDNIQDMAATDARFKRTYGNESVLLAQALNYNDCVIGPLVDRLYHAAQDLITQANFTDPALGEPH